MTSVAPLRKLFKPILAQNPDLVLQGRWLIRPPLSYEAEKRLRTEGKPIPPRIIQDTHDPNFQDYLIHNFNVKARLLFDEEWNLDKAIAWLKDYIAKPARGCPQEFHGWAAAVTGDFANAAALLTEQRDIWASFGAYRKERKDFKMLEGLIAQLKTLDAAAIADYLHGLEAATIKEYKLDAFWQRTPFPFEGSPAP